VTGDAATRHRDSFDGLVVEASVIPLVDGDADRRDRQLRAIVGLLRGVLARREKSRVDISGGISSHLRR
jgi:hypothetical protein